MTSQSLWFPKAVNELTDEVRASCDPDSLSDSELTHVDILAARLMAEQLIYSALAEEATGNAGRSLAKQFTDSLIEYGRKHGDSELPSAERQQELWASVSEWYERDQACR